MAYGQVAVVKYTENIDKEWQADRDPDAIKMALELRNAHPQDSVDQLKNLADLGSSLAMVYIGDAYANGRGLERDVNVGVNWYIRAADHGSTEAAHRLAFYHYHMKRFNDSIEILRRLSDQGFSPATYCLGLFCYHGVGVEKSLPLAMKFWELAASRGHLLAARKISFVLRSGVYGLLGVMKGIVKMFFLIIPYIRCSLDNPRSDRLREW